ncbi:MAG TPA: hypothetical protein PKY59_07510 [Pyrinomonadaceae bacterium]|nr:hypothetical protein [Pyrinomonadaceae bacterium]
MRSKLIIALFFIGAVSAANAQETTKTNFLPESKDFSFVSEKTKEKSFDRTVEKNTSEPVRRVTSQSSGYTRPTAEKRFKRYVNSVIGPFTLLGNAIGAGFATLGNEPEEWGKKPEGFGRRFASNLGRSAIRNTTTYALDEAFKLDSGFYKSQKRDPGSRIKNAVLSTFTARKTNGKRVLGVPRLVGTYTGSIIAAETWFPKRFNYKDGLRDGTISLGFNTMVNLFREFILKK